MLSITSRDDAILDALALRIRVLSLEQIVRTWWSRMAQGRKAALHRLRQLEEAGKLHIFDLVAHPEIYLARPVSSWVPGHPTPDHGALSYKLKARWIEPPIVHTAVIASKQTGRHYGGWGGRYPRSTERTHDIHMATVFLVKQKRKQFELANWLSEEKVRERQLQKRSSRISHLPDAIVTRPKRLAVEFGGAYTPKKLESFHTYCEGIGLRYEIW